MKNIVPFLYFLMISFFLSAQQIQPLWERTEPTDGGTGTQYRRLPMVLGDSFNNVIVCAETYNPGPLIGFVITKYDSAGNFLWQRRYDTPAQDILTAAVTDNTGAVYVGGNSTNSVTNKTETLIIKYAATGDTLWQYSLPVETSSFFNPSALLLDTQQNVLVFSNFIDASSGNSGLLIMKLNPDGNIIWTASYDEGNYGYIGIDARKVADRYVFWGQIGSSEGNRFFAWQVSDGGETLTTDSTDVYTESFGRGYFIDEFGSLFIGDQYYEYKVTKFDLDGSIDWVYNNPVLLPPSVPSAIDLQSIATTVTGEVLLAGVYNDTSGLIGLITKVSTAGEFLWEQKINFSGIERTIPQTIRRINDDIFTVTGAAYSSVDSNFYEPFLAFYDKNGFKKGGISNIQGKRNQPVSIVSDSAHLYIAGRADPEFFLSKPSKQFLCKYMLDGILTTDRPVNSARMVGKLSVSPNPFKKDLDIAFQHVEATKLAIIAIHNHQGALMFQRMISLVPGYNHFQLDITQYLPAGMYTIALFTPEHVYTEQVFKVK